MSTINCRLIDFEQHLQRNDLSLFDKMTLPAGIDKNTLTNSIILSCAEFECLYSDPIYMIDAIGVWSVKYKDTFEKWIKAETAANTVNPLENYDRYEEYEDIGRGNNSTTVTGTNTTSTRDTGTVSESDLNTVNANTTISAFDSSTLVPNDASTTTTTDNNTTTNDLTTNTNVSIANQSTGATQSDNTHTGHLHGNIGVTTATQMWLEWSKGVKELNLYDLITDLFATEFLILVY